MENHIWKKIGRQLDNEWRNLGRNWETTTSGRHSGDNWETTFGREVENN
jgi:hypothetical protein